MAPQKKILVVEDNRINRAMLCEILSGTYTVIEAENGKQALERLHESWEDIALILLDIIMPVMDGYSFLQQIKADPALSSIPVIVTTQSDSENDEVSALSHGAADFVTKPYRPQIILHRVASIINLRETAAMVNRFKYDPLTGIYNKEYLYQRMRERLQQNPRTEYDLIASDIENFKLVNDIFGVQAGNRVLCEIAALYRELAGENGLCGRINADRFVCMIERGSGHNGKWFQEHVNTLPDISNVVIKWGVYEISDRQVPVEQMCDRALLAAASIKGQYNHYCARYDGTLRDKMLREQAITECMEQALTEGQFVVYLQPKYSLKEGCLAGAEALVRWQHPTWGLVPPNEFIPLFEKNGFITRLDQYVWEQACVMLHAWEEAGLPQLPVSVNVSRADVYQANLVEILQQMLQKYDLAPSILHLEITESAYTETPDQIIQTLTVLRAAGFIIEMDDFGSGYSSLNMLNRMPLDILKLDMKFIQSETAKPADQGILRFIMSLARWMDLTVVAEGVETREQLDHLIEIGCDYVQGYYFARPMPKDQYEEMLHQCRVRESLHIETVRPAAQAPLLLVVDEDPDYRTQVCAGFSERYQVLEAGTADEAFERLSGNEYATELVILSLSLPENGGLRVLRALRQERALWQLPILATSQVNAALEEQALELGANDFAAKPHTQHSLHRRVQRLLGQVSLFERERVLQDAALRDDLTGLLNRRGLRAALKAMDEDDMPAAFCLFDLEDLKHVNDGSGHNEGDRMLTAFSVLLRQHTRSTDILARYGGDAFVVVIKQIRTPDSALRKGGEICDAFQSCRLPGGAETACSAGIVMFERDGSTFDDWFTRADEALLQAKSKNKGCCLWEGEKRND